MPERPEEATESTADMDLRDARPGSDRVAMERARARAELALFGTAEPARMGRYRVLDPVAGGGMGLVYSAYDPELDRKVALKVLHPRRGQDDRSRRRLIVEARALAKLDHPNVVKVHDVLTIEGQVVIVMELVDGQTLAQWEQAAPRTWREVLAVYLQAGDGLAAAHAIDVIHRDFKPSNAIVGTDGRVRVLDFGLARLALDGDDDGSDEVAPPLAPATDAGDVGLTFTGDVIGTLGYAAPEQLRGEALTAAADQFSFAVSLQQAIDGAAPFTGATVPERLASIAAGPATAPPAGSDKHVPAWLRAAIARGLAADPAQRYPALRDLLAELRRPRGWRRWRVPIVVAGFAAISAGVALAVGGGAADDACDGGKTELATVWTGAVRDGVSGVIAGLGTPYAHDVGPRVATGLDHYAIDWSAAHRAACVAHRRGATSAPMLDRQMVCLRQRLGDLRAAVDVLGKTDRESLPEVMDVVARMPAISRCTDVERLSADVEPPDDAATRAAVAAVRAEISNAEALSRAGRSEPARAAAAAAVDHARATTYAPIEVEAALAEGRILIAVRDLPAAVAPLTLARTRALEQKMVAAAVEAAARLIYVEGELAADAKTLDRDLAYVMPLSAAHDCDHVVRPLLLNNIGTAYLALGDRTAAKDYFERAKTELGAHADPDLELTVIDRNLAMLTADSATRTALAAGVWQRLRDALGDEHPATIEALMARAEYTADPAVAHELMAQASTMYHQVHPTLTMQLAIADAARAFLAGELADRTQAATDYAAAIETTASSTDPDIAVMHDLMLGEDAILRGDADAAIAPLQRVSDRRLASKLWYEREDGLRAEVGLGLAAALRGRDADAIAHLEVAVAGYPVIIGNNEEVKYKRVYARAQHALAAALRRTAKDPTRADALERDARAFYSAAGSGSYRWVLEPGPPR